jgi:hypothetical protein
MGGQAAAARKSGQVMSMKYLCLIYQDIEVGPVWEA